MRSDTMEQTRLMRDCDSIWRRLSAGSEHENLSILREIELVLGRDMVYNSDQIREAIFCQDEGRGNGKSS